MNYVWQDGEVPSSHAPPQPREEPSHPLQESDVTMEEVPEVPQVPVPASNDTMAPLRPSQSSKPECRHSLVFSLGYIETHYSEDPVV